MRVLATAMFVAFAMLGGIGGKETKANQSILDKSTIRDLVIRHRDHAACSVSTKPVEPKKSLLLTSWQSVVRW